MFNVLHESQCFCNIAHHGNKEAKSKTDEVRLQSLPGLPVNGGILEHCYKNIEKALKNFM